VFCIGRFSAFNCVSPEITPNAYSLPPRPATRTLSWHPRFFASACTLSTRSAELRSRAAAPPAEERPRFPLRISQKGSAHRTVAESLSALPPAEILRFPPSNTSALFRLTSHLRFLQARESLAPALPLEEPWRRFSDGWSSAQLLDESPPIGFRRRSHSSENAERASPPADSAANQVSRPLAMRRNWFQSPAPPAPQADPLPPMKTAGVARQIRPPEIGRRSSVPAAFPEKKARSDSPGSSKVETLQP